VIRPLFCLFSALSLAVSAAQAKDVPLDALLASLEKAESSFQTLRFSFTQTTRVQVTGEEQVLTGKAVFRKPNRFRVEHLSPRPLVAVSNGETLWVHNPARNQVMEDKWENWAASAGFPRGLTPFQESRSDLKAKYNLSLEPGNVLKCVPKDPGAWPYTLRLWVDPATGLPTKTELSSQSLRTVTDIRDLQVNPELPDETFSFKAPAGADVFHSPSR
jgi:outer membrane lipoprotein carrier protein